MKDWELNHAVAEKLFGWRWLAFMGTPVRGTPGYSAKCIVRRFFPPALGSLWDRWMAEHNPQPATGREPLDYSYCSMSAPHQVPDYVNNWREMELRLVELGKFDEYLARLGSTEKKRHLASGKKRCLEAIAVMCNPQS